MADLSETLMEEAAVVGPAVTTQSDDIGTMGTGNAAGEVATVTAPVDIVADEGVTTIPVSVTTPAEDDLVTDLSTEPATTTKPGLIRGVCREKHGTFRAMIFADGHSRSMGGFPTREVAAVAVNTLALQYGVQLPSGYNILPGQTEPLFDDRLLERAAGWKRRRQRAERTQCGRGHSLEAENVYVSRHGRKMCKVCHRIVAKISRDRKRAARLAERELMEADEVR